MADAAAASPAGDQSHRDHGLHHPGRHHAGAGYHHRQRRAALYAGQRVGERRPDQLGADVLHRRGRDHDAAIGLSRQPVRPQARADGGDRRLRRRLGAVRHRAIAVADRAFRLLQGFFGAALVPISQGILLDIYTPEERGSAMALFGVSVMVGPVLGPVIGGWLTDQFSWRWVFYINVPIGVLAFAGISIFMRETKTAAAAKLDWLGFGTLSVAIAALQMFLDRGAQLDWFSSVEILIEAVVCAIGASTFSSSTPSPRRIPSSIRSCSWIAISRSECCSSSSSASPIWRRWR